MGSPYPLEKKNQILGRILSKEITVAQAHREYGIAESCLYHWLKAVKTSGAQPAQRAQSAPLPRGMNLRAAIVGRNGLRSQKKATLIRSMSKKGCSPDNSACEGFFGRIKNEMFYNRDWHAVSLTKFEQILDEYLNWYAQKRIKVSLGVLSPVKFRKRNGIHIDSDLI